MIGACSTSGPTDPAPEVSGQPAAPDRFGAPLPSRSLEVQTRAQQPCGALTESQLRALQLEPRGRIDQLTVGTACVWEGPGFSHEVSVALYPNRDLLVDTYRSRAMYQYFEPIVIAGLPATAQQTTRGALSCTVTTGAGIGQAVDVSVTEFGAEPSPPCDTAVRATEAVLANLPEQAQK
ncbi:DUF3558 domain-containing protein [Actinomycetospora flava]|uniref:DUF3558 domain-containing protein n=1 Tax=Actinomycetospora flava TaxID=3129232 RepID=A0ABU8M744_9PSEU